MSGDPDGVVVPFRRPDPLAPIQPNPFGEPRLGPTPILDEARARIAAALADLAAATREAFRGLREWACNAWLALIRLSRIPPRTGWRAPARTLRRADGPATRAVRIDRKRRRAQLRRSTRRRRTAA